MQRIMLKDKTFIPYITSDKILGHVKMMANQLNHDLVNEFPIFLVVLNGAFMFAADLLKQVSMPCEVCFVKLSSYLANSSTGRVNELIGLSEDVKGRTVVVVEDIVDTGNTIEAVTAILLKKGVKQLKIASFLLKPEAYNKHMAIDYVGIEIPNDFVVGYGLDYDGLGRNLEDLFVLKK